MAAMTPILPIQVPWQERLSLVLCLAMLALAPRASGAAGSGPNAWSPTGAMHDARADHTATRLRNGDVLVAGGVDQNFLSLNSAELFTPRTGTWTRTGSLATSRASATTTLLSNGNVLVAGGCGGDNCTAIFASAELYHPASGVWTPTGSMHSARYGQTATLFTRGPLAGKVLVAGGFSGLSSLASAEVYDPNTGHWAATGAMNTAREDLTATLLPSGKVLVAGGRDNHGTVLTSAELFNPATGTWTATGSMHTARFGPTATPLLSGQVLVAGGLDATITEIASAELYDPATGTFTPTGSMAAARSGHQALLLRNGKVLVTGGCCDSRGGNLASAELYDPARGTWSATGAMSSGREGFTATMLYSGRVLAAGGCCSLASAEIYTPGR